MKETAEEKRLRLNRFSAYFHREMLKSTLSYCRKLYFSGNSSEAISIMANFIGKSYDVAESMILKKD